MIFVHIHCLLEQLTSNKIHIPRMWSDLCTDSEWKGWAKTNCAKSCNMCGDVDPTVTPTGKRRG